MKHLRVVFVGVLLTLLSVFVLWSCSKAFEPRSSNFEPRVSNKLGISGTEDDYVPGEYVLQVESAKDITFINKIAQEKGTKVEILRTYKFSDVTIVTVKTNDPSIFEGVEGIKSVDKNYIYRALATPNDTYYRYQWHYVNIKLPQAWDIMKSANVVVAVVDTGVSLTHPDLQGIFVQGYDFVDRDTNPTDPANDVSHGTHCIGTIAALTNNSLGVAGVNWGGYGIKIMPIRVLGPDGSGTLDNVAAGIRYAVDNGAKIVSLSLGGSGAQVLMDAVKYAYSKNVTLVCAAGNENMPSLSYPAAYVETIAVGATRYDNKRAAYSNYNYTRYYDPYRGAYVIHYLDVVAPGGDTSVDQNGDGYADGVLSTTWTPTSGNTYMFLQGTSMATPHVAALAAMLYARGYTTPEAIRKRLIQTAYKIPGYTYDSTGWNKYVGYGLIDAYRALSQ
ncbi:S8 family peptidase [Fervidobacterium thailandense]|uniref:Peptidase S8 n=1 Tax=Fervidobacterium thailandense TaxID=1008305 RepID=A0A1E3G254_9BACT|nr:S8 family peptidase [Fervidobacterium thailandense]ODN30309.1 peptidase S8 [Fervidobacterium thailandense]